MKLNCDTYPQVGRGDDGELLIRGLFISEEEDCFTKAAALSLEVRG